MGKIGKQKVHLVLVGKNISQALLFVCLKGGGGKEGVGTSFERGGREGVDSSFVVFLLISIYRFCCRVSVYG